MGLWFLDCGGQGRFELGATAVLPAMPVSGELLLASTPAEAFHCFTQACSYPESACFDVMAEGRVRLVDCRDGAPMPASQLAQPGPPPPGSEAIIAVVGSRPLVVTPVESVHAPPASSSRAGGSCCGASPGTGLFGQGEPAHRAVVTQGYEQPAIPIELSTTPPDLGTTGYVRGDAHADAWILEVPEPPLSPDCGTAEVLRTESKRLVDAGNEAMVRGDLQQAIDEYRAALTLDLCNPYAWADLGAIALRIGEPADAALALSQAVEMQPRHYTAYTNLGLAYEALGQQDLARDAYRIAIGLRPHHGPAQQGLVRLGEER
jgi:hypothetical protein